MTDKTKLRLTIVLAAIFGLTMVELVALLYTNAQWLAQHQSLQAYVSQLGGRIPLVDSFGRCPGNKSSGVALMLALNVSFMPIKVLSLWWVRPHLVVNPDVGLQRLGRNVGGLLFALVALVPAYMWFNLAPASSGLASLDRKLGAMCNGGFNGFVAAQIQGGFALLGSYVATLIVIYLVFNFVNRIRHRLS